LRRSAFEGRHAPLLADAGAQEEASRPGKHLFTELPVVVAQAQVPNAPVYAQHGQLTRHKAQTQQAESGQAAHGYGVYSTQSSHGTWLFAPDPNGGSNS
jgi:hypothetical protein